MFTNLNTKYIYEKFKVFMRRQLKMEVEKKEILLEIILTSTFVLTEIMKKKNGKKRRAIWAKDWIKRREQKRSYNNIISGVHLVDLRYYRRYIRMNPETFKVRHYYYTNTLIKLDSFTDLQDLANI